MKNLSLTIALLLALAGCAAFWSGLKTTIDIARCLCENVATEQLEASPDALDGLDVDEWCEKNLQPFVDEVAEAKQSASQRVGFRRE